MFLRTKTKKQNSKVYTYYQLVESYSTPKGPRQRVVASLGDLSPRPRKEWLQLIREVEVALSGQMDFTVDKVSEDAHTVAERVRQKRNNNSPSSHDDVVPIHLNQVETKDSHELGPEYVGVTMWERLGLDDILASCGLCDVVCKRVKLMVVNALCEYESEHAMPDWARRTAIGDLIGLDTRTLSDSSLYRALDEILPHRDRIERDLNDREDSLFRASHSLILYDLTSTYFEGEMKNNLSAKRGYSRDKRSDCKQVVMGLILDGEGFIRGHMLFDGNRRDNTTLQEMIAMLDKRSGDKEALIVMDRGLSTEKNLDWLRDTKRKFLVAERQGKRDDWQEEFLTGGWEEVIRPDPPTHPGKKRCRVEVKRKEMDKETILLCRSEGRKEKDAGIRTRFMERMEEDLEKLRKRVATGRLKQEEKIHEAVGRLRERYPRVARYYAIDVVKENETIRVDWSLREKAESEAEQLDGTYLLRTNCKDLDAEQLWKTYIMLTLVESAFCRLKSVLYMRPIRHQLQHREEAHLFVCVLAYHLLHAIEVLLRAHDDFRSWKTIRNILRTHRVNTIILPAENGDIYELRKPSLTEERQRKIYDELAMDSKVNRYPNSKQKRRK